MFYKFCFFAFTIFSLCLSLSAQQRKIFVCDKPSDVKQMNFWLEKDVLYLINEVERKEFLNLNTVEEKEEFIEKFWLKRDPTPETEENEFRELYYSRIAFANEHFASVISGWRTDRGIVHILY
jgi:GWxTD domain-containing protein